MPGTSQNLRIRAQEIESLLRGLPNAVLKTALELAVARLEDKARTVVRARLALCKTRDDGIRVVLQAVGELARDAQDEIAVGVIETAAQASLGSDD